MLGRTLAAKRGRAERRDGARCLRGTVACHWHAWTVSRPPTSLPVGTGEQRSRDVEAESLRRLEVDHQLELGWQLHRQVAGLFALENSAGIDGRKMIRIYRTRSVTHEPAGFGGLAPCDGGQRVTESEGDQLSISGYEGSTAVDEHRASALPGKAGKSRVETA